MEELERILWEHAARYPEMQPADAVKLIYQNEFGGGHLIRDMEKCLEYLRREYSATRHDPSTPLFEPIGNGILRVNLASVGEDGLERLGRDFIASAEAHRGTLDSFLAKLAVLERLTREGIFNFDSRRLEGYLVEYQTAGYPAVSHSPQYRTAYSPAYRVVCQSLLHDY